LLKEFTCVAKAFAPACRQAGHQAKFKRQLANFACAVKVFTASRKN
jgi:hypothetical protein